MGKNGSTKDGDFIELGGWEIKKVKEGLDETQVVSLINDLLGQRDELNQRTEHLSSLTRLAERTVTEADKLVEDMKAEAAQQAQAEAASVIARAETKAQAIEAEANKIKLELKKSTQGLFNRLLAEIESLKQQAEALQAQSERSLETLADEDTPPISTAEVAPPAYQEIPPTASLESPETTPTASLESPEATPTASLESPETTPAASQETPEISEVPAEETVISPSSDASPDETTLGLELEIMPPLDIMKIMEIVTYLDNQPEIEYTELIPNNDSPSIIVSLRQPIDLADMLRALPEVAEVEEDKAEPSVAGQLPKLRISLAAETVTQQAK